jgi:hypothetical protein
MTKQKNLPTIRLHVVALSLTLCLNYKPQPPLHTCIRISQQDEDNQMTNSLSATAPRVEVKEWQRELEEMSAEEQLKALRDLYGEATPIDETPELLQRTMDELQISLERAGDKDCFLEAQNLVPDVVNSFDFRLIFLRSVRFDAEVRSFPDRG